MKKKSGKRLSQPSNGSKPAKAPQKKLRGAPTPELDGEIWRHINNRFDGNAHPFKSGRAGMEAFARVTLLTAKLDAKALIPYLAKIDELIELIEKQDDCQSCRAKLNVYAWLICKGKLPAKARRYCAVYKKAEGVYNSRRGIEKRDFLQEVLEEIAAVKKSLQGNTD